MLEMIINFQIQNFNNQIQKIQGQCQSKKYFIIKISDALIDKLQQKNYTLKKQVNKIQRVLSSIKVQQKPRYGLVLPQIKPDTLKKQLQNAYKQIKIYQYQVEKRRNMLNSQAAYIQQINKIQKIYKQKVEIHQRLKRQMILIKNQSKELVKNLKNNLKKTQFQNKEIKLSTDIKYLYELLRQYDLKRTQHITQLQKQRNTIKQMQKEILKENSVQLIQSLRTKIFKSQNNQHNYLSPSRSIIDIQNQAVNMQSRVTKTQSLNVILEVKQDKSPQLYNSFRNDVKLLKKMQSDYQTKINLIMKQKDQAAQKNFKSRNKLLQVQFEIQTIQKNIQQLKKLIDPKMLKPIHFQPQQKKKQIRKKKGPSILHSFKFIEFGQITKNGKRFSDRAIIGKKNSKIIAVSLYQKTQTLQFVGIQATYQILGQKSLIKKGNLHMLVDPKKQQLTQEKIQLNDGDFFKAIDLFMKKNKIIGISILSSKNKIVKIGDFSAIRQVLQMKESQYPMCLFGSLLKDGFEYFGVQIYSSVQQNQQKYMQQEDG